MNHLSRRSFLATAASTATVVAGCLGKEKTPLEDASPPDGVVANAPIPSDPSAYEYAVMGRDSANVSVDYYGNWKCPHCARFSSGFLKDLVSDYVEPSDAAIRFRGLAYIGGDPFLGPDAPRAARAGLSVWHNDPESYWTYHEHVFKHQPSESVEWATTDTLIEFMEQAGVSDTSTIRGELENGSYEDHLQRTVEAANDAGVSGTPILVIDGQTAIAFEKEKVRSLIEDALDSA